MPTYELGKHRGKYVAIYHDEQGIRRRRSLGTTEKSVAINVLAKLEREYFEHQRSRGYTISQLYAAYIVEKTHERKPAILQIARSWNTLKPYFEHLRPENINKDLIRRYTLDRLSKVSPSTVNLELGYLRACLKWAVKDGLITQAPFIKVPPPNPPRDHWLTRDQVAALLRHITMPHLRLFVILAVTTAARSNAILDLTWDRVDMTRGLIDLRNPRKPETHKGRAIVPLNTTATTALSEAHRHATCNSVIEYHSHGLLNVHHSISKLGKQIGIKVTPHMLRHTAAVWMAEAGVPMSEISQYLGHRNTNVTERVYARYSPQYLRKAANALELEVSAPFGRSEREGV
jgi:integrase